MRSSVPFSNPQAIVDRLRKFQRMVRASIIKSRHAAANSGLHTDTRTTNADTIYKIDTEVDPILESFCEEWGREVPLVLIAEGMEDEHGNEGPVVFPHG